MKYKFSDIAINSEGDIVVGPTGDMYVIRNIAALRQGIEVQLRTDIGDLLTHPKFGSQLRNMIGKRNTRQVAEEGRLHIISCLSYDGFIDPSDINVTAIPTDTTNILYHVEINNDSYVIYKFDLLCDLENGIRRV